MGDDIAGDIVDTLLGAHQGFHLRPFGLGFLCFAEFVLAQLVVQLGNQLFSFIAKRHPGQTAFVVYALGRAILDRLGDVVDVNVVTEYGGCINVGLLDRSAGKAEICCVRQGIAQVFGKAVDNLFAGHIALVVLRVHGFGGEPILGTVRFVRDHDDVAAIG